MFFIIHFLFNLGVQFYISKGGGKKGIKKSRNKNPFPYAITHSKIIGGPSPAQKKRPKIYQHSKQFPVCACFTLCLEIIDMFLGPYNSCSCSLQKDCWKKHIFCSRFVTRWQETKRQSQTERDMPPWSGRRQRHLCYLVMSRRCCTVTHP